jgi:hypothetical protein
LFLTIDIREENMQTRNKEEKWGRILSVLVILIPVVIACYYSYRYQNLIETVEIYFSNEEQSDGQISKKNLCIQNDSCERFVSFYAIACFEQNIDLACHRFEEVFTDLFNKNRLTANSTLPQIACGRGFTIACDYKTGQNKGGRNK